MKILILTSTRKEIEPVLDMADEISSDGNLIHVDLKGKTIDILISGIGIYSTLYRLLKHISNTHYDIVINAGIAGSFNGDIQIGDVVQVVSEEIGDLGIESQNDFKTIFEMAYANENDFPFTEGKIINPTKINNPILGELKEVIGLTVNTAHGREESINYLKRKFNADVETMEGAALFYVCLLERIDFIEIRSISNYVEERNVGRWDIPRAINKLGNVLIQLIDSFEK